MALTVDYYVSLNSPWTYLGAARIEAMCARHGATLNIWPVDFGAVFAVSGGLPLPKRSPQRQAYRMMELKRWRDQVGVPLTLTPKYFPYDELQSVPWVTALREARGHAAAIKLAHAFLAATWAEERNVADLAERRAIATACGFDAAALEKLAADPKWLAMREADTRAAIDRGVFGAPSFVIGEEIFWGQDRLEFVERRLARG